MASRSWASGFGELASRARVAVQEAADVVADAFEPRGAESQGSVVNIGFADAPVVSARNGSSSTDDLLALWSSPPQVQVNPKPEPEPEPEAEPDPKLGPQLLGRIPVPVLETQTGGQRIFNVLVMPGILIEREKRVYVSASSVEGFYRALAERLAISESFQVWQLDPIHGDDTGELRLVGSLDCLADMVRIHLELSDEALSQRAIDTANAQVFDQIKSDMASYMEGAGPTARFDTWLTDSVWMRDTGGERDENGVPLRAAGSVVRDLWDQEAAWQEEKRKDQRALEAQSHGGELTRGSQADMTFSLKVCRGGVHAGGPEDVVVRSPDHTVSGLVVNICRRLKIPLEDGEELVLSIGNGDMCRVVRSLDQLPQSCPVQLWRAGSGPGASGGRTNRSALAASEHFHATDAHTAAASARLQSQLQLAVTHPDIRRAINTHLVEKEFPQEGSTTTPPHEHDGFLFTTYMTDVFSQIRESHSIDPQQFFTPMMSLYSIANPGGKSGASFYTTADGSFFLKSVTRQEFAFLTKLMPELAHRLKLRDVESEAAEMPSVPGNPTPGSSAWIKAQQQSVLDVATVPEPLISRGTKVHYPGGTIPLRRLVEFEAAGKLDSDTPVYVDGMEEWLPLKQVRQSLLAALDKQALVDAQDPIPVPMPAASHSACQPNAPPAMVGAELKVTPSALNGDGALGANAHVAGQGVTRQDSKSVPVDRAGSLLPTFMALYSVRGLGALGGLGDTHRLVVMRNGLPPASPRCSAPLTYVFDLKGSTRGRRASASERQAARALSRVTLKDLDWRDRFVTPLVLSPQAHQRLLTMLRGDVAMLETMGVVDYSLLLGLHMTSSEQSRLLPPPPSLLKAGQQTADVETRASAEAATFKANFDAMCREMGPPDTDEVLQPLSSSPGVHGSLDNDGEDEDTWGHTAGCKWVRGSAVVKSQAEERLCHFEVSVSIVDVLSSGSSAVKTLEALKNKAMYESAASVLPAPEYSSRFLQFATTHVFARGSAEYGLLG